MRRHQTGWHAVVDGLLSSGHGVVFGLPADDLGLLTAAAHTDLRLVLCRDQRNAVFMATGYAQARRRAGVCVVGKGPALANAVSGLLEAHASRTPLLLLATGTSGALLGTGAFQELDQVAMARPLVKWAYRVEDPDQICPALDKALTVAEAGCPGPVYLELPEPVGAAPAGQALPWQLPARQFTPPDPAAASTALDTVLAARRPLVLVGGGGGGRGGKAVLDLAEMLGAGVFVTASGRGAVGEQHPLFCGLAGLYAAQPCQELWQQCDLVIALGTRLEETAIFGWSAREQPPVVVQVNVAETDFSSQFPGPRLLSDAVRAVRQWLYEATPSLRSRHAAGRDAEWTTLVRQARAAAQTHASAKLQAQRNDEQLHVAEVLAALQRLLPENVVLVQENGLQDMWSYHYPYWTCVSEGGSVTPSEQTSLGFGAAAAIGVRIALPDRPVAALVGDGAFEMFRADLVTAVRERVQLLWIVLDNGGYGWLQHQLRARSLGDSRFSFTSLPSHPAVDWDLPGLCQRRVRRKAELASALEEAWKACLNGGPAVVRIPVSLDDVPPGLDQLAGDFPSGAASDELRGLDL